MEIIMGSSKPPKVRSVKFVVDGVDELDVRLDDLESKFEDMLVLIAALSTEIGKLKEAKKAPAKKAPAKKLVKKK
jgi:hypothetical protein